jgi:cytoskeletal protein RodZ
MDGSGGDGGGLGGSRSGTPPGKGDVPPHHRRRLSSFAALASSTTSKVSLLGFLAIVCVFPFLFSSVSQQQQALEQYGTPGFRYEALSSADKAKQQHLRTRSKPSSADEAPAAAVSDEKAAEPLQQQAQQSASQPRPQYEPQAISAKPAAAAPAAAVKPNQKGGGVIYMDWVLPSDRCVNWRVTSTCATIDGFLITLNPPGPPPQKKKTHTHTHTGSGS